MRYVVGNVYPFLCVRYISSTLICGGQYHPWEDTLESITLFELQCKSHHKVPLKSKPNDEKKYDGYIFSDIETEELFYNNYPSVTRTEDQWVAVSANSSEVEQYCVVDATKYILDVLGYIAVYRKLPAVYSQSKVGTMETYLQELIAVLEKDGKYKVVIVPGNGIETIVKVVRLINHE